MARLTATVSLLIALAFGSGCQSGWGATAEPADRGASCAEAEAMDAATPCPPEAAAPDPG